MKKPLAFASVVVFALLIVGCADEPVTEPAPVDDQPIGDVGSSGYETTQWEGFFNPGTFVFEGDEQTETLLITDDKRVTITIVPKDEDKETVTTRARWDRIHDGIRIDLAGESGESGAIQRYFKGLEMEGLTDKETNGVYKRVEQVDELPVDEPSP